MCWELRVGIARREGFETMPLIEIYTSMLCGYCHRAKRLLAAKGVAFSEIDVGGDARRRQEMTERAGGRRTVPQIFIGDTHVGGCDELYALDRAGKLDPLLASVQQGAEQPAGASS
jgi:glutaredoxin 3